MGMLASPHIGHFTIKALQFRLITEVSGGLLLESGEALLCSVHEF